MIASGGRSEASNAIMGEIKGREWGLQILDEVHQVVATKFSRALALHCHARVGLTATLVREDGRDRNLTHLLGPKLYEANWKDLTLAGYLANVQCTEVWCPMAPEFYREYLRSSSAINVRKALSVLNPIKAWAMDFLIKTHEARGDKIIIFSESVFALDLFARAYGAVVISGDTPQRERDYYITAFRSQAADSAVNKLFLSRVGDVALDVPDANVIIQISSHFGSRLQEAQRMGRILRRSTRAGSTSGNNSYFYSLISTDTLEVYFANKRRRCVGVRAPVVATSMTEGAVDINPPPAPSPGTSSTKATRTRSCRPLPDSCRPSKTCALAPNSSLMRVTASKSSQPF